MIRITQDPLDAAELLRGFSRDRQDTGAVVSFTGLTRSRTGDRIVDTLTLEAYPGFTERVMEAIEADSRARFEVQDVLAVHRWGAIAVGEPVIFVAVAAAHRRPAFEAADFLMDHFKTRAPFWKREDGPDGRRWIEPRDQDHADLARWAEETPMTDTLADIDLPAPGGRLVDLPFVPVRIAILTISDTRDEESDTSGKILADRIAEAGHLPVLRDIVPDDVEAIRARVRGWIADGAVDAIITTGGTGLTGRDVTPEALEPLFDKRIDGFSVIFHQVSYQTIGLSTLQSRATAGLIDGVFVFCLPGSNGAVRDGWDKVIRWQLDSRHKPCNMVELMPRLLER